MKTRSTRLILFILIFIGTVLILLSYFFSDSRAGRLTSNEEYMKSLQEASRGKQLAGQSAHPATENAESEKQYPSNLLEEIIFQLKAVFKVR